MFVILLLINLCVLSLGVSVNLPFVSRKIINSKHYITKSNRFAFALTEVIQRLSQSQRNQNTQGNLIHLRRAVTVLTNFIIAFNTFDAAYMFIGTNVDAEVLLPPIPLYPLGGNGTI
jgi:hypothetical protein